MVIRLGNSSAVLLCAAAAAICSAQTVTTFFSFDGTHGDYPTAPLNQGINGDFYGTTEAGGSSYTTSFQGYGSIFKITPAGALTTLYSAACSTTPCPDAYPLAGLTQDANGAFYGTTTGYFAPWDGPNRPAAASDTGGTIFRMTPAGVLDTLYTFCVDGNCASGSTPFGGLNQPAFSPNFYGTTRFGGTNGHGTVYKVTPAGKLTTVYDFCSQSGCADGANPWSGVIQASNGYGYGTTMLGGANITGQCASVRGASGCGTIYQIAADGTLATLHSFDFTDGAWPETGLIQGTDGNLYGTTSGGGTYSEGTIFRITPSGALTTLYSFCSGGYPCPDGFLPLGLIQASDGNFYGVTVEGGVPDALGTVFEITPGGKLTTLHTFTGANGDGAYASALSQLTNGDIYVMTEGGGANDNGAIFQFSLGLSPFVIPLPASGEVGTGVKILGTNLTDATSVTFNGVAAAFRVNASGSAISTSVPAGASTGTVQVVTPGGTLSGNAAFQVK